MRGGDAARRGAAGRRDAVVHDRVRPRHDHHVPADDGARAGARGRRARRARPAPGDRGRPDDRRRAGQDRPRAPPRARRRRPGSAGTTARVDATPLFLVLLSEVWRWTGDSELVNAPAAGGDGRARVDRPLRRPRRRRLRRVPPAHRARAREPVVEGLGRLAAVRRRGAGRAADRARPRCRATSTTRSCGWPSSRARSGATARSRNGSSVEAAELRARFDEAFWVDDAGRLSTRSRSTRDKRPVDSLCSNLGHLLWSGIVPPERVEAVVDRLMGDALWSGWGVRTMSTDDAGYNPLSYHNGTVWPHDTSLAALGARARRARWARRAGSCRRCSRRRATSTGRCPRSSPAYARAETPFPIAYPTAARPQAWAAGTPVLLLRLLLGLEPDTRRRTRCGRSPPGGLPSWAGRAPALGRAARSAAPGTCTSTTASSG